MIQLPFTMFVSWAKHYGLQILQFSSGKVYEQI